MIEEDSDERTVRRGFHGPYHWMTVAGDVYMGTVLGLCPELVLDRRLAVTSLDSGVRRLSEAEISAGWQLRGDVAYSPLVNSVDSLRLQRDGLDFPGYDEWYVFHDSPPDLGRVFHGNYFEFQPGNGEILVFVNSPAFVLHDPEPYMPGILGIFLESATYDWTGNLYRRWPGLSYAGQQGSRVARHRSESALVVALKCACLTSVT